MRLSKIPTKELIDDIHKLEKAAEILAKLESKYHSNSQTDLAETLLQEIGYRTVKRQGVT